MKKISVLDCTLRDGGYCNNWKFGKSNIIKIIQALEEAGSEIIECGYLSDINQYDEDYSKYGSISQIEQIVSKDDADKLYVCMINYGEVDLDALPDYGGGCLQGIRVVFHKDKVYDALNYCAQIIKKGYKVFVQPMAIMDYSDEEVLNMIDNVNYLKPYAFYIVDSFGVMKKRDLLHLYYMVEYNLSDEICLGYHSHNNLQLSYSNAQAFAEIPKSRDIIIDCCIFGMGRGAGNLNSELFMRFLNETQGKSYQILPLIAVYDEALSVFYNRKPWGYSLANYLSAVYKCHPDYATYFEGKSTLTIDDLNSVFNLIDNKKRNRFDAEYAANIYAEYMGAQSIMYKNNEKFVTLVKERGILIIASGKSTIYEKNKIDAFIQKNNCVVISINTDNDFYHSEFIFLSNKRRYKQIDKSLKRKMIITSNIYCDNPYMVIAYDNYINNISGVEDNSTMMLISYLIDIGIKQINIAGLDGFSTDLDNNYADESMMIGINSETVKLRNKGIAKFIKMVNKKVKINLITEDNTNWRKYV